MTADLLDGHFRPGEWLKQADIEDRYSANRFDVRMAFTELAARHLIEHLPNRGYRVSDLSDRERAELLQTRAILEREAVRIGARKATADDLRELRALVEAFALNLETGDLQTLRRLNARFHDRLYALCGNSILTNEIRALRHRGQPGVRTGWRTMASIQASHDDHIQMLRLLETRDGDALANMIDQHLNVGRYNEVLG